MKILYTNRPQSAWIGGDYVQMLKTAEHLGNLGMEIEIIETPLLSPAIRVREFDIIHTWNFSMIWAKYAVIMAEIHKKPLVVSMIYHESDQFIPYDQQQIMADVADALIFLNEGELARAERHLKIDRKKVHFVMNGIDKSWFKKPRVKANEKFVLTVGRVEPSKGQLATAKACKELGKKYICAGERYDEEYSKLVEAEGGILIGPQNQKELINLYATCEVMCLASRAEIMSLVVMEAMAQDCSIVLTDHSEWKPACVTLCEFDNQESIKAAIETSIKKKDTLRSELIGSPSDLVRHYLWENVAQEIKEIYEGVIMDKANRRNRWGLYPGPEDSGEPQETGTRS